MMGLLWSPSLLVAELLAIVSAVLFVGGYVGLVPAAIVLPWLPVVIAGAAAAAIFEIVFWWEIALPVALVVFVGVALVVAKGLASWGWPL